MSDLNKEPKKCIKAIPGHIFLLQKIFKREVQACKKLK